METILMKFIRGTYILHLSGIKQKRKRNNCEIIRPLLHFSKAELEEYLNEKGISFIYDASNESDKYFRNRIRTNILPHIQAQNPNYIEKVNQFSQEVSYLSDFLAIETQKFYEKHLVINENGFWLTGLKRLNRAQKFVYISQVFEKYYQGELIISQVQMENLLDGLSQNQYPLTIQLQFGAYLQLKSDELRLFKR
jgi:tRNA(Ile)-lysidine synthase TilS/MesJ